MDKGKGEEGELFHRQGYLNTFYRTIIMVWKIGPFNSMIKVGVRVSFCRENLFGNIVWGPFYLRDYTKGMFLHNVSFVTNCRFVSATVSSHFSAALGVDYAYVLSVPEHYARLVECTGVAN